MCPVKSIGMSKSLIISESWRKSLAFSHADQLRGQGVTSPMSDHGRKATVLAHKDLAVETLGVHAISWGPGHSLKSST